MTPELAHPARSRQRFAPRLRPGWSLVGLLTGFPLLWAAGVSSFAWILAAIPLAMWLSRQPRIWVPRGFGLWLFFLACMFASVSQLSRPRALISFSYNAGVYVAGAVFLLYLVNQRTDTTLQRRLLGGIAALWSFVILAGITGSFFPDVSFRSPMELALPQSVLAIDFVRDLVHPALVQNHTFLGYSVPRPSAPFTYTNEWGSTVALLTPLFLLWLTKQATGSRRVAGLVLLCLSIYPMVLSVNRGLWLSLTMGLLYAAVRVALRGDVRGLAAITLLLLAIALAVSQTGLRELVNDRLEEGHSDQGRINLYEASIDAIRASPFLGYAGTVRQEGRENRAPVGTHGQIWLVTVAHGVPAGLTFVGFLLWMFRRTWRASYPSTGFWAHTVIFISIVQLPFYSLLPAGIPIVMIAVGLALREEDAARTAVTGAPG